MPLTPMKAIEDIRADYIMDVEEMNGDCYMNAEVALRACYGMTWQQARDQILQWVEEAYAERAKRLAPCTESV